MNNYYESDAGNRKFHFLIGQTVFRASCASFLTLAGSFSLPLGKKDDRLRSHLCAMAGNRTPLHRASIQGEHTHAHNLDTDS